MSSTVVLSEIESDAVSVANVSVRSDTSGVTAELKVSEAVRCGGDSRWIVVHSAAYLHNPFASLVFKCIALECVQLTNEKYVRSTDMVYEYRYRPFG